MRERARLMHEIEMCSFYLTELQLYLDTHPNCANARRAYRQHVERQENLLARYAEAYGPVVPAQAGTGESWDWTNRPWPWEGSER